MERAIFPHEKKKSFLAEKKFCGEVIASCAETSVHAMLKKSRACKKKFHAKFMQNSRKNHTIETQKIKKVHAQCKNRRNSAGTVLYVGRGCSAPYNLNLVC